jgi:hypothetical protein
MFFAQTIFPGLVRQRAFQLRGYYEQTAASIAAKKPANASADWTVTGDMVPSGMRAVGRIICVLIF